MTSQVHVKWHSVSRSQLWHSILCIFFNAFQALERKNDIEPEITPTKTISDKRVVWKVCILSFQFAQFIQQVRFKVLLNRRWIYVKEIRLRRNSILRIIYLKGKTLQGDDDSKKKKKYFDSKTHFFNSKELKWTKLFGAAERRLKILSLIRDRASGVRDTSAVRQNIFSALVQN